MIVARNLTYVWKRDSGDKLALDDLTFEIPPGEFVCFDGSVTSGRTTLLRLLWGERVDFEGSLLIDGLTPVEARRQGITGMVGGVARHVPYCWDPSWAYPTRRAVALLPVLDGNGLWALDFVRVARENAETVIAFTMSTGLKGFPSPPEADRVLHLVKGRLTS